VQIKVFYIERKISEELYALSQGHHDMARVFSRCFIHEFFFRTASIEVSFSTKNSRVSVKGDAVQAIWIGMVSLKRFSHLIFLVKKKSYCLSVICMMFLPLLRTKVEVTVRINMGLYILIQLVVDM